MENECALYGTIEKLHESHILPKFAFDYIKKTGSTHMRNFANPNVRMQDGIKMHLLSHKAEQDFGLREKWFKEKIFAPYQEGSQTSFDYDERLYYFAISILWRTLIFQLKKDKTYSSEWYFEEMQKTENAWKLFLRDSTYPQNYDRIYIHLTDHVNDHDFDIENVDGYFTRVTDFTVVTNDITKGFFAVYAKFTKFIFWGIIKGANDNELTNLRVNPLGGVIKFPQENKSNDLGEFYMNRIKQLNALPKPSEHQQDKMINEIKKNPDKFFNSEIGRVILNDLIIEKKNRNKKK